MIEMEGKGEVEGTSRRRSIVAYISNLSSAADLLRPQGHEDTLEFALTGGPVVFFVDGGRGGAVCGGGGFCGGGSVCSGGRVGVGGGGGGGLGGGRGSNSSVGSARGHDGTV